MTRTVDLNCDMGEGFGPWTMGDDEAMLDVVTSINVACGFHAGDPSIMRRMAGLAAAKGIGLGAHPGFADLQGFGRRRLPDVTPREVEDLVAVQIGALQGAAALEGARVTHVKAHGALSNMAAENRALADAVARAIQAVDARLVFVVLPGTALEAAGTGAGLPMARELFADRAYMDDLTLMPRSRPGAVLHDPELIAARVVAMVRDGAVVAATGARIPVPVDTICVHGDTPGAVEIARRVRTGLQAAGIAVRRFGG